MLAGKTNLQYWLVKPTKKHNNVYIYTSLKAYTAGLPWWSSG